MTASPPRAAPRGARPISTRGIGARNLHTDGVEALVAGFEGCSLRRTAKSLCFARGSASARIMLFGEAPGRDEDLQGKPFVGRAGQLLDRMLAAIGLAEDHVYITNTVYWRPPGTPHADACRRLRPAPRFSPPDRAVVALRSRALGAPRRRHPRRERGIMRLRGKWLTYPSARPAICRLSPRCIRPISCATPRPSATRGRDLLAAGKRLWIRKSEVSNQKSDYKSAF